MHTTNVRILLIAACYTTAVASVADNGTTELTTVGVQSGNVTFIANTNVTAISIKGKSSALVAKVELRRQKEGLRLEHIEARLPVKTLLTGMGLRDDHMRKYIFTTTDGQVPDLLFEGANGTCSESGKDTTCQVAGMLTVRGVARPFTMPLKIHEDGAGYKAAGEAVVKLSAYGIEQPTQFGVKTSDDVLLHFDFVAKPVSGDIVAAGGHR